MAKFRYSDYALTSPGFRSSREGLLPFIERFTGKKRVVDLGCGEGLFLDLLDEAGIEGWGIDADERMVMDARARGRRVLQGDLVQVLRRETITFDGAFCSHVVEHLGFEAVLDLVEAVRDRLDPGALLLLLFPNPGNLDMQLRYFWRDPEHVRFYGGDLIAAVLRHYGFEILEEGARFWKRADEDAFRSRSSPPRERSRLFGDARWRLREFVRGKLGITAMEADLQYVREVRSQGEDVQILARKPL